MDNRTGELTPKQQTSEAIRQAETILVLTGQNPQPDQVASAIGLTQILRKFGKKVTAIVSDKLPENVNFLDTSQLDTNLSGLRDFIVRIDLSKAEVDKLKYTIENGKLNIHVTPFKGGFAPSDVGYGYGPYQYDLVIVLGVASRAKIDKVFQDHQDLFSQIPIVNLDFHRSNEQYGAINLVEPYAASLAEILVALSESLQTGLIDEPIATSLLTGIMASTDRFTASHTTAKSLTVAAQLMAAGAKQPEVVRGLYKSPKVLSGQPVARIAPKPQPAQADRTQLKEAIRAATSAQPESIQGSSEPQTPPKAQVDTSQAYSALEPTQAYR